MPEAFCVHNTPPRANFTGQRADTVNAGRPSSVAGPLSTTPNWWGLFDPARHVSKELKVAQVKLHDGHVLDAAGKIQEHLAGVEDYMLGEAVWREAPPRTSVSAKASDQGVEKLLQSPSAGGQPETLPNFLRTNIKHAICGRNAAFENGLSSSAAIVWS